jgi:leucyl-tRNA synthetase
MKSYDHKKIEKKWQKEWETKKLYNAKDGKGEKSFILVEFPFPSGAGLHTGHIRSYTALDIVARKRRMEGKNVLFPMGWDAFGLPTEQYAIKTGEQPKTVTKKNADTFRKQLKAVGLSFDWSREINTTDPEYYRWTQWIFLQLYKEGLAYKATTTINWCPKDKIGLANEEVVDGCCERCGASVEQREKEQWILAITKYADRLDKDLDTVDYPERVKVQQRNWIGKKEEVVNGKTVTTYNLRDWIFSRQRYWGEPIPIIHCLDCGIVSVPEKDLPVKLPAVKSYEPTDNGESPLAAISSWVNVQCPTCKGPAKRETDTMPNWAGSSWYYLRYTDPKNKKAFADPKKLKYWTPVDWYNGGMEHTTLHLLYSRFWHKVLYDMKLVPTSEPYAKRTSHGMILAEGGAKMSKSKGNVVNPDEIVATYGADTLRVYEMFMGPFEQAVVWSPESIIGSRRFIERVWRLATKTEKKKTETNKPYETVLHQTIKKVGNDIESVGFNTAISQMMMCLNEFEKEEVIALSDFKLFLRILAPFAPHVTEELWCELGEKKSIHLSGWPAYDESKLQSDMMTVVIQVNSKTRAEVMVVRDITEEEITAFALSLDRVQAAMGDAAPKKIIYVKGRLLNIVL